MTAYYNEIDKYAAEWLRNLIKAGIIAPGDVDDRSIEDVSPRDLVGYTQCHFFAGIGVWSYALRRAGWPDDKPVWTGSCPCQPFSAAGKGMGFADERHLWPAFHYLIEECRPSSVIGEQVASKDGLAWLDLVQADREASRYAFAAADLCAAGVGAPHIRQRLYWVADACDDRSQRRILGRQDPQRRVEHRPAGCDGPTGGMDDPSCVGRRARWSDDPEHDRQQLDAARNADNPGPIKGFWSDADWLLCRDGKWRPVEPGTFPLAHGAPARVGRLRAYGNAINAEVATEFIKALR